MLHVPLLGQLSKLQGSGWREVQTVSKKVQEDIFGRVIQHRVTVK